MDALDLLEQQHRDVASLIDRVAEATSPGERTSLVAQVVRAIEAHSRVEERCFYTVFRARIGDGGRLYEVFEHHALLRFAAVNLLRTRATDLRFTARLEMVRELSLRHAEAEEDWAFPKAKRNLCDEELDVIGVEVARAHDALMAARAPKPTWDRSPRRGTAARDEGPRARREADRSIVLRLSRDAEAARPVPARRAHRETARPIPRASTRRSQRPPS